MLAVLVLLAIAWQGWYFGWVVWWKFANPSTTSFMSVRLDELREKDPRAELKKQWVPYERVSNHLKRAVIAAEDAKFSEHEGFDWEGIQKALEKNRKKGKIVAGGSTITQQLAKNLFLSGERTVLRKGQEFVLTFALEACLSKRRILEIYLNNVEWGEGLFGAQAAARHYFRTDAALKALKMPCEITGGGKTSIVAALAKAREVLDAVHADEGLPADKKFATVFLLTDGQENMQTAQEVHEEIGKLRAHPISPVIAVVSFGIDADDALLLTVANEPTERQVQHLQVAGVLGLISQEPRKLFLKGHSGGTVTKDQAEAIRNFLNVLSDSIASGQEKVAKG